MAKYVASRWLHRKQIVAAAAAAIVGSWVLAAGPAVASSPQLSITASPATTVGLEIFANVNVSGGGGGNITFQLFGPGDPSCSRAIFTSTVASGPTVNSKHFPTTSAGTYQWRAAYNGGGATSCTQPSAAVIVGRAFTAIEVTALAPVGGMLQASAALGAGYHPTGTVSFFLSPPGDTFCATTVFTSTVAVNGDGNYRSTTYPTTATGTYKWRASYSGDANSGGGTVTACLAAGAAVDVSSAAGPPAHPTVTTPTVVTPPPTTAPHTAPSSTAVAPTTTPSTTAPPSTGADSAGAPSSPTSTAAPGIGGLESGTGPAALALPRTSPAASHPAGTPWALAIAALVVLGLAGGLVTLRRTRRRAP